MAKANRVNHPIRCLESLNSTFFFMLNFRRNFSVELSAQKLVRLVFNGHVLQPDSKTLNACGLFDNCVVHCLIHNPRPGTIPTQNQPTDNPPVQTINEGLFF